ncbi:MAG: hypothetical protein U0575_09420 [Phycisphaerales bacterium]
MASSCTNCSLRACRSTCAIDRSSTRRLVVRDDEPTRLGTLNPRCRGDLETIVAKAIEKDATRRYPSMQAFGDDLRQHLADEPIRARPTTRVERVRRFARRHRTLVWSTAATMVALVVGTVTSILFAFNANAARRAAEWTTYRASMTAAVSALEIHDVRTARQQLEQAPARYRDWEWDYVAHRLDESAAIAPAALLRTSPPACSTAIRRCGCCSIASRNRPRTGP